MEKTVQKDSAYVMMHEFSPLQQDFEYEPGYQDNGNYASSRLLVKGFKVGGNIQANDEFKHSDLDETGHSKDETFDAGLVVQDIIIYRDAKGTASGFSLKGWMHVKMEDVKDDIGKFEKGLTSGVKVEFGECNEVQIGKANTVEEKDMGLFVNLDGLSGEPSKDLQGSITILDGNQVGHTPRSAADCKWLYVIIKNFDFCGDSELPVCGRESHSSNVSLSAGNQNS